MTKATKQKVTTTRVRDAFKQGTKLESEEFFGRESEFSQQGKQDIVWCKGVQYNPPGNPFWISTVILTKASGKAEVAILIFNKQPYLWNKFQNKWEYNISIGGASIHQDSVKRTRDRMLCNMLEQAQLSYILHGTNDRSQLDRKRVIDKILFSFQQAGTITTKNRVKAGSYVVDALEWAAANYDRIALQSLTEYEYRKLEAEVLGDYSVKVTAGREVGSDEVATLDGITPVDKDVSGKEIREINRLVTTEGVRDA